MVDPAGPGLQRSEIEVKLRVRRNQIHGWRQDLVANRIAFGPPRSVFRTQIVFGFFDNPLRNPVFFRTRMILVARALVSNRNQQMAMAAKLRSRCLA